jgi:hypothetical protein
MRCALQSAADLILHDMHLRLLLSYVSLCITARQRWFAQQQQQQQQQQQRAEWGLRPRDAHYLGDRQWVYNREIAAMADGLDSSLQKDLALRESVRALNMHLTHCWSLLVLVIF